MTAPPTARTARQSRRLAGKGAMLLVAALGASVLLLAASQAWVQGRPAEGFTAGVAVRVTGGSAVPLAPAAALVGAAAAVTAATAGRVARWLAAAILPAAGLVAALAAAAVARDPGGPVGSAAARAAGVAGTLAASASVTPWLWVGAAGALLLVLAGVLALVGARTWPGLPDRYAVPPPAAARPAEAHDPRGTWDQLSRGADPTDAGAARSRPAGGAGAPGR